MGSGARCCLVNVDMLFVCTVQDGSHWPYVAVVRHCVCGSCADQGNLIFCLI